MAPESTRSSSSTASRLLRGLLRRTLRDVRPIAVTPAARGAAGQARRIAWTRSTVAPRTTPPLICHGARRDRRLPPAGRPRVGRSPRPRRLLRPPRYPLRLVHGPSLPAGAADGALLRGVDDGGGARRGDRARAPRPPRARQRLPPSGAPREDGGHARSRLGRPPGARPRQRLLRARVRRVRPRLPGGGRARWPARRGARSDPSPLHRGRALLRRPLLPPARRAQPAASRAAAAPADPRRRRGREAHPPPRRPARRRVELPYLRARRADAEAPSAASRVRAHRPRSSEPAGHGGGGARARPDARAGGRRARPGRAPLRGARVGPRGGRLLRNAGRRRGAPP